MSRAIPKSAILTILSGPLLVRRQFLENVEILKMLRIFQQNYIIQSFQEIFTWQQYPDE